MIENDNDFIAHLTAISSFWYSERIRKVFDWSFRTVTEILFNGFLRPHSSFICD